MSKKKEFVYVVQSMQTDNSVNSLLVNYFSLLSNSFEMANDFVKENKFAFSILLAGFIVSSFLLKGF